MTGADQATHIQSRPPEQAEALVAAFNRPPRILRTLPAEDVEIPAPPPAPAFSLPARLAFMLIPAVTGVFYLITLVARGGQGSTVWFMLPIVIISFVSVGASIWNYIAQRRAHHQARMALANAYAESLARVRAHLHELDVRQRAVREENDPDISTLLLIVQGTTAPNLPDPRLWERRPGDHDFLHLRIGCGDLATSVTIKPPPANQFQYTPELRQAVELARAFALVRDVPITVPLRELGSIGIAGADAEAIHLAYAVICQLVVHHSPHDVRLAAFWSSPYDPFWSWLRWLPHTHAFDDDSYRLLARYDGDPRHLEQVVERLQRELRQRVEHGSAGRAHVVVVLDSYSATCVHHDIFADLIRRGGPLGFSVVCLVNEVRQVPGECNGYVELGRQPRLALAGPDGGYCPLKPDCVSQAQSELLARALASVTGAYLTRSQELPASVRFSTLLDLGELTRYDPARLWVDPPEPSESWHPVPVGVSEPHAERFVIDLNEGRHGVHGIVAGTTGSGKSEFLLTFLMALAIRHSPDRLNLMLIDFKGGATFKAIEKLPHTVGMVTDLEGYQAERALIAINSALDNRKQLLKNADVSNIRSYRQRAARDSDMQSIPNLLIVIDEFDEMVRDYPDLVQELVRVAKQGRSLGVHLLFATQQPLQIKDGLLRNISYWIALRVVSPDDSKAMVTIPDASYLTAETPGRGYFRANKKVVLFQSARVTLPYQPIDQAGLFDELDVTGRRRMVSVYDIGREQFIHDFKQICRDSGWPLPAMALQILHRYKQAIKDRKLPARVAPDDAQADLDLVQQTVQQYLAQHQQASQMPGSELGTTDDELVDDMLGQLRGQRELETELLMIARTMEQALGSEYAARKYRVWNAPLASQIPLVDILDTASPAWAPVPVGVLDYPVRATQEPLRLDLFGTHGNLLVVGGSRAGKTTLLRTLMLSLAMSNSPADLWIYTIDANGRGCGMVIASDVTPGTDESRLPHLSDTLMPYDGMRIEWLVNELTASIEQRRRLVRAYSVDTLSQYRQRCRSESDWPAPPPGLLVIVDNLAELIGAQPESLMKRFVALIREARPFDIAFVVTVSLARDIDSTWQGLFETRIALRVNDETVSESLIGKKFAARIRTDQPGRGFLRTGDGPIEVQIALPMLRKLRRSRVRSGDDAGVMYSDQQAELKHALRVVTGRYRAVPDHQRPRSLRVLPPRVELAELLAETEPPAMPFAREGLTLRPVAFDLDGGMTHLLIAGSPDSDKPEALRTLLAAIVLRSSPDEVQVVPIDYRRRTLGFLLDTPYAPARDVAVPSDPVPASTSFGAPANREHRPVALVTNEAELAGVCIWLRDHLYTRMRTGVARPRLILALHDLDLMIGRESEYLALLAPCAMRGVDIGFHVVLTASDFSTSVWLNHHLIKAVRTERCGLYLGKPPEAGKDIANIGNTGVKWPGSLAEADFPPGRGLFLLHGHHMLVQVAFAGHNLLARCRTPGLSPLNQPCDDATTADQLVTLSSGGQRDE